MKRYKFRYGKNGVGITSDKAFAIFMNKKLTLLERIILWFS